MPRIALGIEYDGTSYAGWQSQIHASSVQSELEAALSKVANHPVEVVAAGRTDAGVHAAMQVVHFDTEVQRSERGWRLGANTSLPPSIAVQWVRSVPDVFHARYSALARTYRYHILNRPTRSALTVDRVCWTREPLDEKRMQLAARSLVGEHDFTSFRGAQCQARTPLRRMHSIDVVRHGDIVVLHVTANAFLHHMVRNIAGVLMAIGSGERPVEWSSEVLAARDRRQGGVTAQAGGLYLWHVRYADALALPTEPDGSLLDVFDGGRR
jgi:tRNA pseudouridine38-40 synthase